MSVGQHPYYTPHNLPVVVPCVRVVCGLRFVVGEERHNVARFGQGPGDGEGRGCITARCDKRGPTHAEPPNLKPIPPLALTHWNPHGFSAALGFDRFALDTLMFFLRLYLSVIGCHLNIQRCQFGAARLDWEYPLCSPTSVLSGVGGHGGTCHPNSNGEFLSLSLRGSVDRERGTHATWLLYSPC